MLINNSECLPNTEMFAKHIWLFWKFLECFMNIFQKLFDWTFLGNTLQCFGIFPFIWNILGKKFLNVLEQFQKCKTFSTEHFWLFGTFWVNSSWMFWNNFKSAKLFSTEHFRLPGTFCVKVILRNNLKCFQTHFECLETF